MAEGDSRQIGMRPKQRRQRVQTRAALLAGVLVAALLVGGAPLAMAATASATITNVPFSPVTTGHTPPGVDETATACSGTGKQITETLSPASIYADATSTSTATATVAATGTNTPTARCKSEQVIFSSSDSNELISATTNDGDGTYSAIVTSSRGAGRATVTAQLTLVNPTPPPLITFVDATATLTQTAGPAANIALAIAVPAAGSSVTQPATVGVGLVAFGLGLQVVARSSRAARPGRRRSHRRGRRRAHRHRAGRLVGGANVASGPSRPSAAPSGGQAIPL